MVEHEIFCEDCNEYVDYIRMSGHANCIKCRKLLGFVRFDKDISYNAIIYSWDKDSFIKPVKQRFKYMM